MLMFIVSTMQNMGFWKCAIVELTWRHPEMRCALNPAVGACSSRECANHCRVCEVGDNSKPISVLD